MTGNRNREQKSPSSFEEQKAEYYGTTVLAIRPVRLQATPPQTPSLCMNGRIPKPCVPTGQLDGDIYPDFWGEAKLRYCTRTVYSVEIGGDHYRFERSGMHIRTPTYTHQSGFEILLLKNGAIRRCES